MPKTSAAQQKNVNAAVQILETTTGDKVPQAMILAGFLKQDIANETILQMILHRFEAKQTTPCRDVTICDIEVAANGLDISPLTGDDKHTRTMLTTTTLTAAPTHLKPKRKQIRATASAVQQRCIDDQALKKHKSDVHKAAVRLWDSERKKPDGMSIRKVSDAIKEKYETCPGIITISSYAAQGLINTSPMKMGPVGTIPAVAYKFLCQAFSSLIPINQMNACAGNNSRAKLILMLAKVFDFRTLAATELLNRVVRDTAIDIKAAKLNCAEDRRIRWMTYQNLDLWFDSWEVFVVEYGFATINQNGELHFDGKMKARIMNLDETCLSLDGNNGNPGGVAVQPHRTMTYDSPSLGKRHRSLP